MPRTPKPVAPAGDGKLTQPPRFGSCLRTGNATLLPSRTISALHGARRADAARDALHYSARVSDDVALDVAADCLISGIHSIRNYGESEGRGHYVIVVKAMAECPFNGSLPTYCAAGPQGPHSVTSQCLATYVLSVGISTDGPPTFAARWLAVPPNVLPPIHFVSRVAMHCFCTAHADADKVSMFL